MQRGLMAVHEHATHIMLRCHHRLVLVFEEKGVLSALHVAIVLAEAEAIVAVIQALLSREVDRLPMAPLRCLLRRRYCRHD